MVCACGVIPLHIHELLLHCEPLMRLQTVGLCVLFSAQLGKRDSSYGG